jgi:hypothetical protein
MHIHSNPMTSQLMGLGATQRTQYAVETKRASEVVRKKLTTAAGSKEDEAVSHVEAYSEAQADARQKRSQSGPEEFRSIYFSITV